MNKQLSLMALAVLPLTGCIVVNAPEPAADKVTASASSTQGARAIMVDVRGMTLEMANDKVESLPHFAGAVQLQYNATAGEPTPDNASSWVVVDAYPTKNARIAEDVVLTVALPNAPADKAPPFESLGQLERSVGAVGIECETNQPASEAKFPDSSMYCSDTLVLSHWKLDTEKSKQYFELQKESYVKFTKEDGPGSSTLMGPNWMIRGDDDVVLKLQGKLGGSII